MPSRIKRLHAARLLEQSGAAGRPRCRYCGSAVTRKAHKVSDTVRRFTMDHVVPRSQGGMFSDENLVTACEPCNLTRGDQPLDQFIAERRRIAIGCEEWAISVEEARFIMERARQAHDRQAVIDRGGR